MSSFWCRKFGGSLKNVDPCRQSAVVAVSCESTGKTLEFWPINILLNKFKNLLFVMEWQYVFQEVRTELLFPVPLWQNSGYGLLELEVSIPHRINHCR
jgi:hypothetical protein